MSVVINSNYAASISAYNLNKSQADHARSLNRLSSGSRINSSGDDAAGLAVSMKMDSQIRNLGALEKNLGNASSFLETQDGALRTVAKILTRIEELETLKTDVTKNAGDIALYDTEISQLENEFTNIRESTFNGIRLFSPTKDIDSIPASTSPLDSSEIDLYRPPLPFKTDPLEIVFLVDISGSMGDEIAALRNNIITLVNELDTNQNIANWGIKVVGYPPSAYPNANTVGLGNNFTDDLNQILIQFDSLGFPSSVGVPGEPLIEALDEVINSAWSTNSTAKKSIVTFTDEPIHQSQYATANRARVAQEIVTNDIAFHHFTEYPSDSYTSDLLSQSGGQSYDLSDSIADPVSLFQNLSNSLTVQQSPVTLELVAQYIAQNGATQSAINTAIERTKTNALNLTSAKSRILDVDVAQESTQLARTSLLLQAGTAMLSQANQSTRSILRLISLN
jgi:flagellin-like hook-associated protein FlgL